MSDSVPYRDSFNEEGLVILVSVVCLAVDKFTFSDLVGTCVHAGFSLSLSVYVCGELKGESVKSRQCY